jgi:hypothetical protein
MSRTRSERRRDWKWKVLLGVSAFLAWGIIGEVENGGSLCSLTPTELAQVQGFAAALIAARKA